MTHSGQGNEPQLPAARHAHEGVVLPAHGEPYVPEQQAAPAAGQPWGQPWGPESAQGPASPPPPGQAPQAGLAPAAPPPPQSPPAQPDAQPQGPGQPQVQGPGQPQPQPHSAPPQPPAQVHQTMPLPSPADETQAMPPHPGRDPFAGPAPAGAPGGLPAGHLPDTSGPPGHWSSGPGAQPLPAPGGPAGDAQATQLIPPMGGSPLPPEAPAQSHCAAPAPASAEAPPESESTTFLGRRPLRQQAARGPETEATQYIGAAVPPPGPGQAPPDAGPFGMRPGAPGDRQPPAEFDGLFRSHSAAAAGTAAGPGGGEATQQMPLFGDAPQRSAGTQPYPPQQQPYDQQATQAFQPYGQQGFEPYAQQAGHEREGRAARRNSARRRLSPPALIAIVVAGCAIAGLAAGAALSTGGSDEKGPDASKTKAAAAGGDDGASAGGADPAEQQAKALDNLLADSNDSRTAVIKAVQSIKSCTNLGKAAEDLRGAANQRNSLVTRLQKISVDKLPDHDRLTSALTRAWHASAAADNHYAAWADQMAMGGKKTCHKGRARPTGEAAAGNRSSGEATQAKQEASGLWNAIARKYGLDQRQVTQL